jgi:hypothetical protein
MSNRISSPINPGVDGPAIQPTEATNQATAAASGAKPSDMAIDLPASTVAGGNQPIDSTGGEDQPKSDEMAAEQRHATIDQLVSASSKGGASATATSDTVPSMSSAQEGDTQMSESETSSLLPQDRPKRTRAKVSEGASASSSAASDSTTATAPTAASSAPTAVEEGASAMKRSKRAAASKPEGQESKTQRKPRASVNKMCKHCGKKVSPAKMTSVCPATKVHTSAWTPQVPAEGKPARANVGVWTCCNSKKAVAIGCSGGMPHEEGEFVPKEPQYKMLSTQQNVDIMAQ